ncbi:tetratricopeptide repeat protein [Ruegeria lacuscaerulensis]|uniref:tetratricopeptide repeat protein n=1 Tax=Ruegeria lacuscaerulensis TaxID=55218 RepID=UPI00147FC8F6|nr:tetratricopeptide repeat protein [Ruegeria lacuscaerulensis]
MKIRVAALFIVATALLLSANAPSQSSVNYSELSLTCFGGKAKHTQAVSACTALLNGNGATEANRNALFRFRGRAYYRDRQFDMAVADYTRALAVYPNDANSFLRRAFAYDALGDTQAAAADYDSALQIDPDSLFALYRKSGFDRRNGRPHAARRGLQAALKIDSGYGRAGYELLDLSYELNGFDGVEAFLKQAKDRWPDEDWVYFSQLLYDLKYTGNRDSALEAAHNLARLEQGKTSDLYWPALVHLKIGDENKGIEYIKKLAVLQKGDVEKVKGTFFTRWYDAAIDWYMWRGERELLSSGRLFALAGRPDLAKSELESALHRFGYAGRMWVLNCLFAPAGLSVPWAAYAGSEDHLDQLVQDYVLRVAWDMSFFQLEKPVSESTDQ